MRNLTLTLALALLAGPAQAASVQIVGPRIRLSDLIEVNAASDGDLGPAPQPGTRRRVYRAQVLALLGEKTRTRLPAYWQVETRSQSLSCVDLATRTAGALQTQLKPGLKLSALVCGRPLAVPQGEVQLTARLTDGNRHAGRLPVQLEVRAGEWPAQTLVTTAIIEGKLAVLVAAADLEPGAPLRRGDVRFEEHDASTLPSDALAALLDVDGKKTSQRISAGSVLRRGSLTEIPIVERGANVTIAINADGIRITSRGVAREDGKRGETITVLTNSTSRLIKARVVEPHLVVVDL